MSTLLVTDSRGKGLQKYLDELVPDKYDVDPYSGENIKKLLTREGQDYDPDYHNLIMIMGGICSITQRDKITKATHIRSHDIDCAARRFRKSVTKGLSKVRRKYRDVLIIILPTMGIDLTIYNRSQADPVEQYTLDSTIMAVNRVIIKMNDKDAKIPWIAKKIHHCRGHGKWTHRYHYLRDGCHFNREMKIHVAQVLAAHLNG